MASPYLNEMRTAFPFIILLDCDKASERLEDKIAQFNNEQMQTIFDLISKLTHSVFDRFFSQHNVAKEVSMWGQNVS